MATRASIRAAFRTGITANTAQADALRDMRKPFRDADDGVTDLEEGLRYLRTTAPAAVTEDRFNAALSFVLPALATLPDTGAGSVTVVRNNLRGFVTDVTSPDWLKRRAERIKRTKLVHVNGGGLRQYDQQAGDPINALADAAQTVIQAANSTAEQLTVANATLARWLELTPDQPTA